MKMVLASIALAAMTISGSSVAQEAAKNYSYKAPSGMFSEGTTKWQMFQFMAEDAERRAGGSRAGDTTGALSNSNADMSSYPRPGERSRSVRRPTSR